MYVRPTSTRLLSGMLIPAMRATSALPLLVTRVLADHEDRAMAADDLALLAHGLDRRSDLHRSVILTYKQKRRRAQESADRRRTRLAIRSPSLAHEFWVTRRGRNA